MLRNGANERVFCKYENLHHRMGAWCTRKDNLQMKIKINGTEAAEAAGIDTTFYAGFFKITINDEPTRLISIEGSTDRGTTPIEKIFDLIYPHIPKCPDLGEESNREASQDAIIDSGEFEVFGDEVTFDVEFVWVENELEIEVEPADPAGDASALVKQAQELLMQASDFNTDDAESMMILRDVIDRLSLVEF